jgi:hypothetical protein
MNKIGAAAFNLHIESVCLVLNDVSNKNTPCQAFRIEYIKGEKTDFHLGITLNISSDGFTL